MADLREAEGHEIVAQLGKGWQFERLDVTLEADWQRAVNRAEESFGPINVLINNVGIANESSIETAAEADYRKMVDTNQTSVFLGVRLAIPSMRRAGGGSILNMALTASITGSPNCAVYSATKDAITAFSRTAAIRHYFSKAVQTSNSILN